MTTDMIHVEQSEGVATVTLKIPTMPPAFFGALGDTFRGLADQPDLRAVVLCSDQRGFSYGLDLPAAFQQHGPLMTGANLAGPRMELRALIRGWQDDITAIERCPVPVIAAVHGWCIGGGLDVATACDIRLVSADAKLSLRETKIAIVADLGSLQRLPRILGQGLTRELAFTGRDVDAAEAVRLGLANRVFDDRAALLEGAQAMGREIADNAPLTVRGVKQVLNYGRDRSVEDGLEYVATWNSAFLPSEDLGEAATAFVQKRPPRFRGR